MASGRPGEEKEKPMSEREKNQSRRIYHLDARFVIDSDTVQSLRDWCSESGKYVWVTTHEKLRVHTLRGVSGSKADVLLPDSMVYARLYVLEIGRKADSFEGFLRHRLCVRSWPHALEEGRTPSLMWPGPGSLRIEEQDEHLAVIALYWGGGMWACRWPQVRYKIDTQDIRGILLHHWKNWFRHVPEEEARSLAEVWAILPHTLAQTDICVLNRTASVALYDLSRNLGWRKLTLLDRRRHGIPDDHYQWIRSDSPLLRRRLLGTKTGAGEYTERVAGGDHAYEEMSREEAKWEE
jgi:hypothetical protein